MPLPEPQRVRLTTRGVVLLYVIAVLLGLTATLWNPWASATHSTIERDAVTQQGTVPGDPSRPE